MNKQQKRANFIPSEAYRSPMNYAAKIEEKSLHSSKHYKCFVFVEYDGYHPVLEKTLNKFALQDYDGFIEQKRYHKNKHGNIRSFLELSFDDYSNARRFAFSTVKIEILIYHRMRLILLLENLNITDRKQMKLID